MASPAASRRTATFGRECDAVPTGSDAGDAKNCLLAAPPARAAWKDPGSRLLGAVATRGCAEIGCARVGVSVIGTSTEDQLDGQVTSMSKGAQMRIILIAAFTVTVLTTLALSGCHSAGRHYEVPSDEFLGLAQMGVGRNTIMGSQFIGATQSRAYIAVWSGLPSSVGGGDHVYSVALDDLPADLAMRIRAGYNPWSQQDAVQPGAAPDERPQAGARR